VQFANRSSVQFGGCEHGFTLLREETESSSICYSVVCIIHAMQALRQCRSADSFYSSDNVCRSLV